MAEILKQIEERYSQTCKNCIHYENACKSHKDLLQHVINDLRRKEVRITPQRQAILNYMIQSNAHPTVEEIYNDLIQEFPGLSLATIYNNLHVLVEHGIIHELRFSDVTRYDFMGHEHGHIICEKCGKITDFEVPGLDEVMEYAGQVTNYQVTHSNIEIYGLCPCCRDCLLNPNN